jgi:hypothetical protein
MTPRKDAEAGVSTRPVPVVSQNGRKPWKKKSPVEVVLEQAKKLREEIAATEEDLKQKRKQLEKFEQACKIFETS